MRLFSARALRNKGYKVIEAQRAARPRSSILGQDGETIDLLITDVVMPRHGRAGLVEEVRATAPDMKVIFISGYTEDAFRQRLDERHRHPFPAQALQPEAARRQGEGRAGGGGVSEFGFSSNWGTLILPPCLADRWPARLRASFSPSRPALRPRGLHFL